MSIIVFPVNKFCIKDFFSRSNLFIFILDEDMSLLITSNLFVITSCSCFVGTGSKTFAKLFLEMLYTLIPVTYFKNSNLTLS